MRVTLRKGRGKGVGVERDGKESGGKLYFTEAVNWGWEVRLGWGALFPRLEAAEQEWMGWDGLFCILGGICLGILSYFNVLFCF